MIDAKIGLLILQPTPFCNINCSYCYLPNRDVKERMSAETFTKILERLVESKLVGDKIGLVWHAGEPLALPLNYYSEIFDKIELFPSLAGKVTHSIQTNGMIINDEWCQFFLKHSVSVGVSIDGPDFLHDACRKDRRGRGTLARVLGGVECLKRHGVRFHVISVVTSNSLNYAEEIFRFFLDLGVTNLGFNIEEKEGANNSTSLETCDTDERVKEFFRRTYELQRRYGNRLKIREFDRAFRAIAVSDPETPENMDRLNDQATPIKILSVDYAGNFSTFSPELLGMNDPEHGDFIFGNVYEDTFESIWTRPNFIETLVEINKGVEKCKADCEYFSLCGGGAPSNKLYENGTFESAETMYCKYTIKYPLDIALSELEKQLFPQPT
ncbi:MAG TPA: cyclophane-forming radical SAM/SPASM peptide maturase GrrM/OscB [Pyrinomonadaceae bacterium]|jgi:uncharacterized protein